jgi:pyrroline-5-carboxylate reductase
MADFSRTIARLQGNFLGVFGAGHLGRAISSVLIRNGFPICRLLVCHGGSPETTALLAEAGLSAQVIRSDELTRRSGIILYTVRPQHVNAIAHCELRNDALIVSFLAGIPLARIPVRLTQGNRFRVMTSAPDTIVEAGAIGAAYPAGDPVVAELLSALRIEQFFLNDEDELHAFTALGVCLPIVLASWRGQGRAVDDGELFKCARKHGLDNYQRILEWAHRAEPRFETVAARDAYLRKAATPGGVTEAMIGQIREGASIGETLEMGIRRSRELQSPSPTDAS